MNDRTSRWIICLALLPVAAPLWWLAGEYSKPLLGGPELECANASISLLVFLTCVTVWRKYVRWSRGRAVGTAGLCGAALLQAALAIPLWSVSGCGEREVLCTSQTLVTNGIAIVGVIFIWWWVRLFRPTGRDPREPDMTPNMVRMTLSLALAPLLCGVYWLTWAATEKFGGGVHYALQAIVSYVVSAAVFLTAWLMIWRKQITWTTSRIRWTWIWSALLAISTACPLFEYFIPNGGGWLLDVIGALGPLIALGVYLVATALLWRENAPLIAAVATGDAERIATCPKCTYSLRGLRELRCPECGWTVTVDEFVDHTLRRAAINRD
ncbi:MAG: hypothetical protein JNG88_05810 [Phycisphaerales bacterium]|nr:hypothetical protein [Phycisphaerales bacterium]